MQIDWTHFTPWTSLGGGVTIGLAAAALLLSLDAHWVSAGFFMEQ